MTLVMTSLPLARFFSMFVYICARFLFALIGGNLTAQSTGSRTKIGWWHSSSRDVVASSLSFSRPAVRAPRRSCSRASLKGILNFDLLRRFAARIIFHNSSVPLLWIFAYTPAIWWKNCALRGKSTKFGMIIVLGLLNNISYGPQSGWGEFVLRGVWGGEGGCSFQINCCYWKESGKVKLILPYQ